MTAEIVVMNRDAVAIAADSAVTLIAEEEKTGVKVFTSADKIFALSRRCPIGMMVFGNATLMGVPWETIIKIYRDELGDRRFDTLEEYADSFVDFLNKQQYLFPESLQQLFLGNLIASYYDIVVEDIIAKVKEILAVQGQIAEQEVGPLVARVVNEHHDLWESTDPLPSLPDGFSESLEEAHGDMIREILKEKFGQLPITETLSDRLVRTVAYVVTRQPPDVLSFPSLSGIVITGFGEKDVFPSLQSFDARGVVSNRLLYQERQSGKIDYNNRASIAPFAQQEMVYTFMEGIDPNCQELVARWLSAILDKYSELIVDSIDKLSDNEKKALKDRIDEEQRDILKQFVSVFRNYRLEHYVEPIMTVVGMLPKDDLAAMAESLVSLTSFKRRVSMGPETVGEPIDVAVISKGDGFIWIKKKSYFPQELNCDPLMLQEVRE